MVPIRFRSRSFILASLLLTATALPASAQTAPIRQVPGVYHQAIGEVRVTALFDGVVPLARAE